MCGSCWGHHSLLKCCCGGPLTYRPSVSDATLLLGTCQAQLCRAAEQHTGSSLGSHTYSFEAECSLYVQPEAQQDASDDSSDEQLCPGVVGGLVPKLPCRQPSTEAPEAAALIVACMGDAIKSRPAFAELYKRSDSKLACVTQIKPYMYVGTGAGIRSSFCTGAGSEAKSACLACQHTWLFQGRVSPALPHQPASFAHALDLQHASAALPWLPRHLSCSGTDSCLKVHVHDRYGR